MFVLLFFPSPFFHVFFHLFHDCCISRCCSCYFWWEEQRRNFRVSLFFMSTIIVLRIQQHFLVRGVGAVRMYIHTYCTMIMYSTGAFYDKKEICVKKAELIDLLNITTLFIHPCSLLLQTIVHAIHSLSIIIETH